MTRLTLRTRLTLIYGGLFLLAGVVLLGATYVLVDAQLPHRTTKLLAKPIPPGDRAPGAQPSGPVLITGSGDMITADELPGQIAGWEKSIRDEAMTSLLQQGAVALLLVGTCAILLGWIVAGRALQPLHRITETARRVADRSLHERIELSGPRDEIRELGQTFNVMLERLDRAFDSQRRFVGNASHELRTPLAVNRALIEVTVTRPGVSADARQLGEALLAVNARHERLIDGLLTLVDSETELAERVPVDLAEIAAHVLATTPTEDREVRSAAAGPALTTGDPVLLERLVQNLVENAVRHNTARGWLSVGTRSVDGHVEVVVANTGPVVAAYEVPALFEPFYRSGGRAGGGAGLGLSIVRAVANAHGGSVTAVPRDGGGLTVTVRLPHR